MSDQMNIDGEQTLPTERYPDIFFPYPGEVYEAVDPNPETHTPPPLDIDISLIEPEDFESVSSDSDSDSESNSDGEDPDHPDDPDNPATVPQAPCPATPQLEATEFLSDSVPPLELSPRALSPPESPNMAPSTPAEEHQALMDLLDIGLKPKPFKNPNWKPSARRNKTIKQILSEQARREASVMATQNNSGTTTPALQSTRGGTPSAESNGVSGSSTGANITQASRNLSTLVRERNMQAAHESAYENAQDSVKETTEGSNDHVNETTGGGDTGPVATYTNIEAPPSLQSAKQAKYCDVIGLPTTYKDPKSGLRYSNKEVFGVVRTLTPAVSEQYLATRNANTILK